MFLQKPERISKRRLRLALKGVDQGLHGDLGGDFAIVMTAHAIGQRHQERVTGITVGNAIFIVLSTALATLLIDGKSHDVFFVLKL
jgi:hypothetical protein